MNTSLVPVCGYTGGKRQLAAPICDKILSYHPKTIADICCGSGAISIELLNRGFPAADITMVDAGPWGWFWRDVGSGQFDFSEFTRLWATMPSDERAVAQWVHNEIAPMSPTSVSFIILQAASFGSTPVWWDGCKWRRGEGKRAYKARPYWEPKPSSKEKKPRGTIFRPDDIPKRVGALLTQAYGVKGIAGKAEDVGIHADVTYIDPPYGGTSGYGCDIDWRGIVANASMPILVSEALAFEDATSNVPLSSRKGASLNGKSSAIFSEWLNVYQPKQQTR